ncbi:hypothetical protein ALP63_101490 [Pseudomonas syringae pv. aceris]|nr:hypothetical protein ALP63_101490 [Pseudomonas syringae pv. aceris]RMS67494.1 hypothetical protein ALP62_101449 [Pseudomonas syringae pv. aceris]
MAGVGMGHCRPDAIAERQAWLCSVRTRRSAGIHAVQEVKWRDVRMKRPAR